MPAYSNDQTITFSIESDKEKQNRRILQEVYSALLEKGYNLRGRTKQRAYWTAT